MSGIKIRNHNHSAFCVTWFACKDTLRQIVCYYTHMKPPSATSIWAAPQKRCLVCSHIYTFQQTYSLNYHLEQKKVESHYWFSHRLCLSDKCLAKQLNTVSYIWYGWIGFGLPPSIPKFYVRKLWQFNLNLKKKNQSYGWFNLTLFWSF